MDYKLEKIKPIENVKNLFPFRIGTTSYILPAETDNLLTNIEYLKNSFDKIQLLLFGKDYLAEALDAVTLEKLRKIREETNIAYSIHLPLDLDLLNPTGKTLDKSIQTINHIIQKTAFLNVHEYILHIDRCTHSTYPSVALNKKNYELFKLVLTKIAQSLKNRCQKLYIENTSYDLTFFKNLIQQYEYKICMDVGHLILRQYDLDYFIQSWGTLIGEIHLHGTAKDRDHLSLAEVSPSNWKTIMNYLKNYTASVIIEVFNEADLRDSLGYLKHSFLSREPLSKHEKTVL